MTTLATRPMSTEVLDSPACAMPEYATYRRGYSLVDGSSVSVSANTLDEILAKAEAWGRPTSRIVRVPVVPFYDARRDDTSDTGRAIGRPAAPGGTWGGACGSGIWVRDTDRRYQEAFRALYALDPGATMQEYTEGYEVRTTQSWWMNGISDRHPEQDGFWLECRQRRHPAGTPCTALDRNWDWRDYAPYADTAAQLSLF